MPVDVLTTESHVLLTGATGLIGGELLKSLLEFGAGHIWTVVRAESERQSLSRIVDRLRRSNFQLDGHAAILEAVPGDMRKPHLGLGIRDRGRIADRVDMIIHCASETSFIREEDCRETNITGMRNLTSFAGECPRSPAVVYISTASNSGTVRHCTLREDQGANVDAEHQNEYTRSKAIAETMLRESTLPFLILRPSIVLSAGVRDRVFARSILWFVPLLTEFDAVPIDPASRLDVVPVNLLIKWILVLLQQPQRNYGTYHLSSGLEGVTTCGAISGYLDRYYCRAKPLELVHPDDWTGKIHRRYIASPRLRKLFSTLRYYLPFVNMDVVYDNTRLQAELGREAVAIPRLESYLGPLLDQITLDEAVTESAKP